MRGLKNIFSSIIKRKRAEKLFSKEVELKDFLLELYVKAPSLEDKELYNYVLDHVVRISDSTIGFFHLVSDDQKEIILVTWNNEALKNCNTSYETHYPIDRAGNWVDCVHLKKPVVYNDFATSPNQKGLPDGHTPLKRFMSVPVIEENKVRIIFGVGNKAEDYDEHDVLMVQLLANDLQRIIGQRRAEEALKHREAYFRSLIEKSSDMITIVDAEGIIRYESPSAKRILGYEPSEMIGRNVFELAHPDEQADLKASFGRAITNRGNPQSSVYRFLHKDGSWRYLELVDQNLMEEDAVKGLVVNAHDVTERKEAEEALRQSEARLITLVHTIPDLVWLKDFDGIYLACNPMFERFFGAREAEIVGKTDYDFVDQDLADYFRNQDCVAMEKETPSVNEEWITFAADGRPALLETIKTPMYDSAGALIGVLGIGREITERKRAEEEIRALSITDQLTGLLNRRGFLTLTEQQLKLSDRTKRGLNFFFADLDGMKIINDTFGHEEGDKALIDMTYILQETFRSSDIISRMGGDEFAVLAIDQEEIDPEIIIQRLQNMIDKHNNQTGVKYNLSMSIGYSFYDPENPSSIDELITSADKMMYEQKKNKKSRSV
jgi:diguanylate cyclase (GGDEF)-like protein/PAS domain S-box-containing protein